jgi:hypothetical protein
MANASVAYPGNFLCPDPDPLPSSLVVRIWFWNRYKSCTNVLLPEFVAQTWLIRIRSEKDPDPQHWRRLDVC